MKRLLSYVCFSLSVVAAGCAMDPSDGMPEDVSQETADLASQPGHTIQNKWSGLCMDIPYGQAFVGQNVNEWTCHGGSNQQFVVEQLSLAGNFQIRYLGPTPADASLCVVPQGHTVGSFRPTNFWLILGYCSSEYYSGWIKDNAHSVTYSGLTEQETAFERFDDPGYCMDAPGYVGGPAPSSFSKPDTGWNNYPLQAYKPCHGGLNQTFDIRN
jgi:hypothetical protein